MVAGQTGPKKGLDHGDVIAGKFIVERTIGMGGMGQVVCARHHELGTRVAIKVVHPFATDAENIGRFKREARAMATLTSDHAVRVYDVGENESGQPYMIMEYLDGRDLGSLLLDRGPLPVDDVVDWMVQACEALVEAHDAKIIHRDLKPQNLFVTKNETHLRVLDFGLAKPFTGFGSEQKLTRPGDIIGTSQYMAPEQVRGQALDGRTDIWGVGVCMYRLLTKEFPFPGASPTVICTSILSQEPVSIRQHRPEIRADVEAIIHRCLQKDPAHRFQTMRDLSAALKAARRPPRSSSASLQNDDDVGGGGSTAPGVNPAPGAANKPITLPLGAPRFKDAAAGTSLAPAAPAREPVPTGPEWTSTHAMMPIPPKAAAPPPQPTPLPVSLAPVSPAPAVPAAPPSPSLGGNPVPPNPSQQISSQPQVPPSAPRSLSPPVAVAPPVIAAPVKKSSSAGKVMGAILLVAIWIGALAVAVILIKKSRVSPPAVATEPAASASIVLSPPPPPPPPPTIDEAPSSSAAASAAPAPVKTAARAQTSAAPKVKPTSTSGGLVDQR